MLCIFVQINLLEHRYQQAVRQRIQLRNKLTAHVENLPATDTMKTETVEYMPVKAPMKITAVKEPPLPPPPPSVKDTLAAESKKTTDTGRFQFRGEINNAAIRINRHQKIDNLSMDIVLDYKEARQKHITLSYASLKLTELKEGGPVLHNIKTERVRFGGGKTEFICVFREVLKNIPPLSSVNPLNNLSERIFTFKGVVKDKQTIEGTLVWKDLEDDLISTHVVTTTITLTHVPRRTL